MDERIKEFDLLKGFGILTVVFFHAIFYNFQTYDEKIQNVLYFFGPLGTPVVVIFFFVSGFLAYRSYKRSPSHFVSKKLKTFLPPYFLWSTIYLLIQVGLSNYLSGSYQLSVPNLIYGYLFATIYLPFYFIFVLLIFYVLTPFIFKTNLKHLMAFSLITGLFFTALYYIPQYWNYSIVNSTITYRNPLIWAFFYLWGMYVAQNGDFLWLKKPSFWVWIGFLLSYAGSVAMIITVPKLLQDYESYSALGPFEYLFYCFSLPVFLWVSHLVKEKRYSGVLALFGNHSFDIYADHILIIGLTFAAFFPFADVSKGANLYIQIFAGFVSSLVALGVGIFIKRFPKIYNVIY
ncbi:acyltransferase [Athalassotoga saccharophila]|uniref:acyltransferase n=1 Tax=Athalassotoga saccharophila TaxID=1441386 RepID=UPI00137AE639|nr:acyltransferase [Athalassotoga saccharophila]BBJ27598.1 acyltransferase family protein [Athalassotoga saccharophila]